MWKERSPGINPVGCCDYSGGEKLVTKMSKKDERKLLLNDDDDDDGGGVNWDN